MKARVVFTLFPALLFFSFTDETAIPLTGGDIVGRWRVDSMCVFDYRDDSLVARHVEDLYPGELTLRFSENGKGRMVEDGKKTRRIRFTVEGNQLKYFVKKGHNDYTYGVTPGGKMRWVEEFTVRDSVVRKELTEYFFTRY